MKYLLVVILCVLGLTLTAQQDETLRVYVPTDALNHYQFDVQYTDTAETFDVYPNVWGQYDYVDIPIYSNSLMLIQINERIDDYLYIHTYELNGFPYKLYLCTGCFGVRHLYLE